MTVPQTLLDRAIDQARLMREAILEARQHLAAGRFKYVDLPTAEPLYLMCIGMTGWVCVIGHPDCGQYEWVVRHDASVGGIVHVYEASNVGYCTPEAAMRNGLNHLEKP